jgi:lipoprotein-anchoring transpeptidase ErfK/SrfK
MPASNQHTSSSIRRRRFGVAAITLTALVTASGAARYTTAERATGEPALQLEASLSARTLTLRAGDSTVVSYPIAIGKSKYPTPRGTFRIRKIIWNPAWVPPDEPWAKNKKAEAPGAKANPMKVVKIFFKEPDYYIHGTGDVESLGEAASHGCLRMDPDDAYRVARYVMEHGGQPRDENWFWRILHFRRETKTVYLNNPIPITIGG